MKSTPEPCAVQEVVFNQSSSQAELEDILDNEKAYLDQQTGTNLNDHLT